MRSTYVESNTSLCLTIKDYYFRDYDDEFGGALIFGGSDPTLYTGEFNYADVVYDGPEPDYWKIQIDGCER